MTNNLIRQNFPTIVLPPENTPQPLGRYGAEIIRMMKENFPNRYWQLLLSGNLLQTVYRREQEIKRLRLELLSELTKKYPRPKTDLFAFVAKHMSVLGEAVDEVIEKELKKPI